MDTKTKNTPNTILSSRGYAVRKSSLQKDEILSLKRTLTVTPLSHPDYPVPDSFPVYESGGNWIRVPRHFGIENFGKPEMNVQKDCPLDEDRCMFKGELRPAQLIPHEKTLEHLVEKQTGLLSLMTGSGKTFIALSLLSTLKQRTCILVHMSPLLQQWKSEINRFLPSLRVGIVQQTKKKITKDVDVYLMMIQTLLNVQDVPPIFGFTIFDEAHHLPSQTFSKILFKVNAKYILALSATPERKDGLSGVITWHLGDLIYQERPDRRDQNTTFVKICRFSHPTLRLDPRDKNHAGKITSISENVHRNLYIMRVIEDIIAKDTKNKRRIVVFVERRTHATLIWGEICGVLKRLGNNEATCGLALGGMKKALIERELTKSIVVATYKAISEGISIEQLNTVVFASPKRDVVQALGRIFRKTHKDVNPLIVDFSDAALRGQERARLQTYRKELNGNILVEYLNEEMAVTAREEPGKVVLPSDEASTTECLFNDDE
jgi:superfamily II DNA or RNA helicase